MLYTTDNTSNQEKWWESDVDINQGPQTRHDTYICVCTEYTLYKLCSVYYPWVPGVLRMALGTAERNPSWLDPTISDTSLEKLKGLYYVLHNCTTASHGYLTCIANQAIIYYEVLNMSNKAVRF